MIFLLFPLPRDFRQAEPSLGSLRHPSSNIPRFFFRSKLRCQHLHYPHRNETKPNRKQGPNIAGSTNICIWTVFHAVFAVPLLSLYSILICFGLKSKQVTGVLWGLWTKCIRLLINSLDALQSNMWKRNDDSLQPAKSVLVAWLSSYWPQTNHRMLAFAAGSFIMHDDNKLRVWHHGPERGSNWHIILLTQIHGNVPLCTDKSVLLPKGRECLSLATFAVTCHVTWKPSAASAKPGPTQVPACVTRFLSALTSRVLNVDV